MLGDRLGVPGSLARNARHPHAGARRGFDVNGFQTDAELLHQSKCSARDDVGGDGSAIGHDDVDAVQRLREAVRRAHRDLVIGKQRRQAPPALGVAFTAEKNLQGLT